MKIHRAVPRSRFELEADLELDGAAVDYAYIRVMQENGQVAWSSPIWIRG